jgi:hypothetical protein
MKHALRFSELQTVNIQTANISDAYGTLQSKRMLSGAQV